MIDLYSWPTPNGHKVHIMLEECRLPYRVHPINIGTGDQFQPDFFQIGIDTGLVVGVTQVSMSSVLGEGTNECACQ